MLCKKFIFFICFFQLFFQILQGNHSQIVLISIPKCGTHLSIKTISLLSDRECISTSLHDKKEKLYYLTNLPANYFWKSHEKYQGYIADQLLKTKSKIIFIYRDPRDCIISHIYWNEFGRYEYYPERILEHSPEFDMSTAIFSMIRGDTTYKNSHEINIANFFKSYLPWSNVPGVLTIQFEDLVGPQGGGSAQKQYECIKKIATHLGCDTNDEMIAYVANNLFGDTKTFRKGKIGDWKNHFNPEHKQAFKEIAGQLLIDLGYEKDLNW